MNEEIKKVAIKFAIDSSISSLKMLQCVVIGFFRPSKDPAGEWLAVVDDDSGYLTCVSVGTLLGFSTLSIMGNQGTLCKFPQFDRGRVYTLAEMMEDPFKLDKWWKENCGNKNP